MSNLISYAFADLLQFSRATSKIVLGSTGLPVTVPIDEPAFAFRPDLPEAVLGLSLEGEGPNYHYASEGAPSSFTRTSGSTVTIATPTGSATARRLTEDTQNGDHLCVYSRPLPANQQLTFSKFFKADGREFVLFKVFNGQATADYIIASFRLSGPGSVLDDNGNRGTATGAKARIEAYPGGWYRCSLSGIPSTAASTSTLIQIYMSDAADLTPDYLGDGVSGVLMSGGQLEPRAAASSYFPNTASSGTAGPAVRAPDILALKGLGTWYSATQGTVYLKARVPYLSSATRIISRLHDGTTNNRIELRILANSLNVEVLVVSGGAVVWQQVLGAITLGVDFSVGVAYQANNYAATLNGGAAVSLLVGALPQGVNAWHLGGDAVGASSLDGYLRGGWYGPIRIPDADLPNLETLLALAVV
jgi:hypothetical protein